MEYLQLVDENDNIIGKEERNIAHDKHMLHRSIEIIITDSKDNVVLQLRKEDKKQYPLFWSSSVGGHISAGETPIDAARREMMEELGIDIDIEFIEKFRIDNSEENEIVYLYFGKSDGPFTLQPEEIESLKSFHIDTLMQEKKDMKMTPHCRKGLEIIYRRFYQ